MTPYIAHLASDGVDLYPIEHYTKSVVVKRRYDSSRRREQAGQTRTAILAAAGRLFVDPGYAATTLANVAAEAGVAVQTLYAVFGSKRRLLSDLVDVTIAGDDAPVELSRRAFVAAVQAQPDGPAKLGAYAVHLSEVNARQADVLLALANAASADPDAAAIWQKNVADRRRGMGMFAGHLKESGCLRSDVDVDTAADVLWLAMDVRNYDWLVRQRGWSVEAYRRWYVDTVAGAVLPR
jgi:AcrR family transcriptional regulator